MGNHWSWMGRWCLHKTINKTLLTYLTEDSSVIWCLWQGLFFYSGLINMHVWDPYNNICFPNHFFFELEPEWEDPDDKPPRLSDDWDLERLFFLFPDEDLERLLFLPRSDEEEAERERERDLFLEDEDPFGDLELDLFGGDMSKYYIRSHCMDSNHLPTALRLHVSRETTVTALILFSNIPITDTSYYIRISFTNLQSFTRWRMRFDLHYPSCSEGISTCAFKRK